MNRYNANQTPTREGDREYIAMLSGPKKLVRTYDPQHKKWNYTKLGLSFFGRVREEYVGVFFFMCVIV